MDKIIEAKYEVISEKEIKSNYYPCFVLGDDNQKLLILFDDVKDIIADQRVIVNNREFQLYKFILNEGQPFLAPLEKDKLNEFNEWKSKKE